MPLACFKSTWPNPSGPGPHGKYPFVSSSKVKQDYTDIAWVMSRVGYVNEAAKVDVTGEEGGRVGLVPSRVA